MISSTHLMLSATEDVMFWFNVSLKSAALLGIAAVVCRFLNSRSAALRHLVWTVAIVASLLLPVAVLILPQLSLPILPSQFAPSSDAPGVVASTTAQPTNEQEANGPAIMRSSYSTCCECIVSSVWPRASRCRTQRGWIKGCWPFWIGLVADFLSAGFGGISVA